MDVPITHINCLGINLPITHTSTSLIQKNCFRIICVIISGLIAMGRFPTFMLGFRGLATGVISALRAQSWKMSPKMSSRASRPRGPKSRKQSRKRVKIVKHLSILTLFRPHFRLLGLRRREARELILGVFFQLWARRAQMTRVAGKSFRNLNGLFPQIRPDGPLHLLKSTGTQPIKKSVKRLLSDARHSDQQPSLVTS